MGEMVYTDPVLVKVEVEVQIEHTAEFLAAVNEFIAIVLATEPCDGFEVFHDSDAGAKFLLIEKWRSRHYYVESHSASPHLQTLYAKVGALLAGEPSFTFWDAV